MQNKRDRENTRNLHADFYNAWKNLVLSGSVTPLSAITEAIRQNAPQWYIPLRTAQREIRIISSVGPDNYYNASPIRRAMFLALRSHVNQAMIADTQERSSRQILLDVLESPAPSFFISHRTARRIIHQKRKLIKKVNHQSFTT